MAQCKSARPAERDSARTLCPVLCAACDPDRGKPAAQGGGDTDGGGGGGALVIVGAVCAALAIVVIVIALIHFRKPNAAAERTCLKTATPFLKW